MSVKEKKEEEGIRLSRELTYTKSFRSGEKKDKMRFLIKVKFEN